jgi:hypothetical protein
MNLKMDMEEVVGWTPQKYSKCSLLREEAVAMVMVVIVTLDMVVVDTTSHIVSESMQSE